MNQDMIGIQQGLRGLTDTLLVDLLRRHVKAIDGEEFRKHAPREDPRRSISSDPGNGPTAEGRYHGPPVRTGGKSQSRKAT